MRIHVGDGIAARPGAVDFVNGVADDNRVPNDHVLDRMRIADGRGDTAGHVCLVEFIGPRFAEHLVLDDRAALHPHIAVRHVESAAAPVADIQ